MVCIMQSQNGTNYLQGGEVIVCNDHKPLARFLNGKNYSNKVNRWGLEVATYNIIFEWISEARNKAADCLSWLGELPQDRPATIRVLSTTNHEGPAFNTRSRTAQHTSTEDPTSQPQSNAATPDVTDIPSTTPKSLTIDSLQALPQCRKQIHSVNTSPNDCPMEKHPNMKLISSYMWNEYSTNMSQIQIKIF